MRGASNWIDRLIHLPSTALHAVVDYFVRVLTDPQKIYSPTEVSNLSLLRKRLKEGDVLLVCGNARISYVVKVLTISTWSHVVLYVGDRRDLLTEDEIEEWRRVFGEASLKHLVIDSDPVRRIHLKPLDEYAGLMLRQCRAGSLTPEDNKLVISRALEQLGREYDIKHILRLLFFFAFPWELLPHTLRRFITDFTLSDDDRICSRVLSEAFHSVGYPIRPVRIIQGRGVIHNRALGFMVGLKQRGRSARKLLLGGRVSSAFKRMTKESYGEIHLKGARHITPADYDLSRFFEIIKDKEDLNVPYKTATTLCPISD